MASNQTNITDSQIYVENIKIAMYAMTADVAIKTDIIQKYEMLAGVKFGGNEVIITQNADSFRVLMNETLFYTIVCPVKRMHLDQFKNLYNMIKVIEKNGLEKDKAYSKMYSDLNALLKKHNIEVLRVVNENDIVNALKCFGLEVDAEPVDSEIIDESEIGEELPEEISEEIFDNLDDILNESEEIEEEPEIEEDEPEEELPTPVEEDDEPKINSDKKELIEKLKHSTLKGIVNGNVKNLSSVLKALYETGFTSFPQVGILGNNGDDSPLIKLSTSDGRVHEATVADSGSAYDYEIAQAIIGVIPELGSYALTNEGETVPNTKALIDSSKVCYKMHLQFQRANIEYSKGRTSIRRWITETQLGKSGCSNFDEWKNKENNGKSTVLTKFKHASAWYSWCVSNIMYEAIADDILERNASGNAVVIDKKSDGGDWMVPAGYTTEAKNIIQAIDKNFRNVIAVSERNKDTDTKELISTEIRISCGRPIDKDAVIKALNDRLNSGVANSIDIRLVGEDTFNKDNVLILKIIFDVESEDKADKFAYEVIDNILDSGGAPTWSHALIGKNEDGTYLYWDDFMNPASEQVFKRCYAIYAGSRSGKGVMTSTLLTSALCDGKQVFYTDGKPENGLCLGQLAWSKGHEAYVFDGKPVCSVPFVGFMENYTGDQRTNTELLQYLNKLPSELFENEAYFSEETQREFLGVMRYLKSLHLCMEIINARQSGKLPMDNWQVWVFDEMTSMSGAEKKVREIFSRYVRHKLGKADPKESDENAKYSIDFNAKNANDFLDPKNEKYDKGMAYIKNWCNWTANMTMLLNDLKTIKIGKANLNIIFIFQEATWLAKDAKITTIGKVVDMLDTTKIVGCNALANACRNYGDAETQKKTWYSDKVNKAGAGNWAIGMDSSDIRTSKVKVFKPYKVWTIPLDDKKQLRKDKVQGDEAKRYIAGYVEYLAGKLGLDIPSTLQSAYDYAESAVKTLDYAQSIKEFMYDCSNFATTKADASFENLYRTAANADAEAGSEPTEMAQPVGDSTNTLNIGNDGYNGGSSSEGGSSSNGNYEETPIPANETPEQQALRLAKEDEIASKLTFMTTSLLMNKNLSSGVLYKYCARHIYKNALKNGFNYLDRDKSHGQNLYTAAIVYSTIHYCSVVRNVPGIDIGYVRQTLINRIQSGQDTRHADKFALGMLAAYDNGSLKYDELPSEDVLKSYALDFINNMNNNPASGFGTQQGSGQFGHGQGTFNMQQQTEDGDDDFIEGFGEEAEQDQFNQQSQQSNGGKSSDFNWEPLESQSMQGQPQQGQQQNMQGQSQVMEQQQGIGYPQQQNMQGQQGMGYNTQQGQQQNMNYGQQGMGYNPQQVQQQNVNYGQQGMGYNPQQGMGYGQQNMQQNQAEMQRLQMIEQQKHLYSQPEIDSSFFNPTLINNGDGSLTINPTALDDLIQFDDNSYMMTHPIKWHTVEKFKRKLFESRNGTAYEFKKRWDLALSMVARHFRNPKIVTSVTIVGSQFVVNGKVIRLDTVLDADYGIQLEDLVNFKSLFKKFPMIRKLIIDINVAQRLLVEYGKDAHAIWKMFQQNKALKELSIMSEGNITTYNRNSFATTADKLNKQLGIVDAKVQLEQANAYKNPKLHEKSPAYVSKVFDNCKDLGKDSFGKAKNAVFADKSPQLVRAATWSFIGALTVTVGGIFGAGNYIRNMFRK